MNRFSDEELSNFHKQFEQHVKVYEERVKTDDARHESLLIAQEANAAQLKQLISNTKEIVDLYGDMKGAAKVGMALQRFGLWLAKWGIIGTMLMAIWRWIVEHSPK